jgi:hypothetical protein
MVTRFLRVSCALLAPLALSGAAFAQAAAPKAVTPADHAKAEASLGSFASQWMDRMQRVEDDNRKKPAMKEQPGGPKHQYTGYTDDFKIEIRPTGYPGAPFVGLIRYGEQLIECADRGATKCRATKTRKVTEIFRFQNGRWVY